MPQEADAKKKPTIRNEKTDNKNEKNVCRDYLNNICNRGTRCKFIHPPREDAPPKQHYDFCLDFQNHGCRRDNCRFIHASREDVENYRKNGDISLEMACAIFFQTRSDTINGIPVCKEFLNGFCDRRRRCRYWHISVADARDRHYPAPYNRAVEPLLPPPRGVKRGFSDLDYNFENPKRGIIGDYPPYIPTMINRRVTELERSNAELLTENDALKRELKHEKERYEDLLTLFRQTTGSMPIGGVPPIAPPPWQTLDPSYGMW